MKLVDGIIAVKAGAVGSGAGEYTVKQEMVPHPRPEGVVGGTLLASVLVEGQVKVVIIEEKVINHFIHILSGSAFCFLCFVFACFSVFSVTKR